jgi:hypothetical protein
MKLSAKFNPEHSRKKIEQLVTLVFLSQICFVHEFFEIQTSRTFQNAQNTSKPVHILWTCPRFFSKYMAKEVFERFFEILSKILELRAMLGMNNRNFEIFGFFFRFLLNKFLRF